MVWLVIARLTGRFRVIGVPWCGWGVLWLVVAQPTIHFCIFGRGASFWRVKSTPLSFPPLAGGLADRLDLGLPASLFHGTAGEV